MRRFGKDIEEAARRIRALMTRQAATTAQKARISAEADKLRASGWRPDIGTVEQGQTLADAQAALETRFKRNAALKAEAARRLDLRSGQLAQVDADDSAAPLPPRLPERRETGGDEVQPDPFAGWPYSRPILDHIAVRNDKVGLGPYGADRIHEGVTEPHEGIDILAPTGTSVYSPIDGKVTHVGWAYGSEANKPDGLRTIHITGPDGHRFKLLYVAPIDGLTAGAEVSVGDHIGSVQDWQDRMDIVKKKVTPTSPADRAKDHVHMELRDGAGRLIDPTPLFERWVEQSRRRRRLRMIEDRN